MAKQTKITLFPLGELVVIQALFHNATYLWLKKEGNENYNTLSSTLQLGMLVIFVTKTTIHKNISNKTNAT